MTPNYENAAVKAMEILIENGITETPINPMPIMIQYPGVRVMPFTRMADEAGIERNELIPLFGTNQDAVTFNLNMDISDVRYVVVYNMRLPFEIIWRGIARELGHVVLGHDGVTRPTEVRKKEALCFAHHLISPRPIIHMLQNEMPLTMNILSATTGCSDECVEELRDLPGVHVPAELNRKVRDLFSRGINEYISFYKASAKQDKSPVIDFGSYMDFYEE